MQLQSAIESLTQKLNKLPSKQKTPTIKKFIKLAIDFNWKAITEIVEMMDPFNEAIVVLQGMLALEEQSPTLQANHIRQSPELCTL